jgi:hypothetical protein
MEASKKVNFRLIIFRVKSESFVTLNWKDYQ